MKKCLVCNAENIDAAVTCPWCGEASWSASVEAPVVAKEPEAPKESKSGASTPPPSFTSRRPKR